MTSDAYFSADRKHRYWLIRVWDESLPIVANIGVNPSTADEKENDHTISKDIGFAKRLRYGGLLIDKSRRIGYAFDLLRQLCDEVERLRTVIKATNNCRTCGNPMSVYCPPCVKELP